MAASDKDTIYIDIDDEITTIIDKVRASDGKVVALVLPKRATVLQSIVNMKLLKRTADNAKKHIALITTEVGILPLAGAVGVHVAKTLTSRPEIPSAPLINDDEERVEETAELDDPETDSEITKQSAADRPIGELAGSLPVVASGAVDGIETLQLDDDVAPEELASADSVAAVPPKKTKKPKKDKSLHVPNFERFRILIVVVVILIIALIAGLFVALKVLPKATISIQTDASNVNTSVTMTLIPNGDQLNVANGQIPAKQVSEQKTYTETASASGQVNNGVKATGSVTMTATECNTFTAPDDVPAGEGVSVNSQTYITQADTTFSPTSVNNKTKCISYSSGGPTSITAQNPGSSFNTGTDVSFTVAGRSDITATGSANGGTDNIQQIVTQTDINSAENKISAEDGSLKSDLKSQLVQQNLYALPVTFASGTPATTSSVPAGTQASTVTVTQIINYSEYGVAEADLTSLLNNAIANQVDTSKQGILSTGLGTAVFTESNGSPTSLVMSAVAEVGPNINKATIASQAAGRKTADIQAAIMKDQNVTGVSVKFSPFWVTTAPSNTAKITVNVSKPNSASNAGN